MNVPGSSRLQYIKTDVWIVSLCNFLAIDWRFSNCHCTCQCLFNSRWLWYLCLWACWEYVVLLSRSFSRKTSRSECWIHFHCNYQSTIWEIESGVISPIFLYSRYLSDRFWYENSWFSPSEIAQIEDSTLAKVILRNTNIQQLQCFVMSSPDGCTVGKLKKSSHDLFR